MRTTLDAFAAHCSRASLTRRPTVWAQFVDVWNTPQGEIGIPDPPQLSQACFAVLSPWVMIPTIGQVWLVYDAIESLEVTHLHVNARGMFDPHWSVEYGMDDEGGLVFGWETPGPAPDGMDSAIVAAKRARMAGNFWQFDYSIENVLPVIQGLLNQ